MLCIYNVPPKHYESILLLEYQFIAIECLFESSIDEVCIDLGRGNIAMSSAFAREEDRSWRCKDGSQRYAAIMWRQVSSIRLLQPMRETVRDLALRKPAIPV